MRSEWETEQTWYPPGRDQDLGENRKGRDTQLDKKEPKEERKGEGSVANVTFSLF